IGGIGQPGGVNVQGRMPTFQPLAGDPNAGLGNLPPGVRQNFGDCAFWSAALRTDATGKARVEFTLPEGMTRWQVVVTAISREMRVGRHTASFKVSRP